VAADSCRNNRIPRGVPSNRTLKGRISQLATELETSDYEVATELNRLLKMNVLDCYFSSHKMHITVYIPVKGKSTKYQLYEILSLPWQFANQQCSIMDVTPFVVQGGSHACHWTFSPILQSTITKRVLHSSRTKRTSRCFLTVQKPYSSSHLQKLKELLKVKPLFL